MTSSEVNSAIGCGGEPVRAWRESWLTLELLAAVFLAGWMGCEPSPKAAIVSGGSMAPSLLGEHFDLVCQDCGFRFQIDALRPPRSGKAVCPNCGFAENKFDGLHPITPEAISLSPVNRSIRRWQIVAIADPNLRNPASPGGQQGSPAAHRDKILVKRVVGLPHESIELRNGNLFIDGEIAIKPLHIQNHLAMLVFDSHFQPPSFAIQRLVAEQADNHWTLRPGGGWRFSAEQPLAAEDWLTYRHVCGYRHSGKRESSAGLEDSYPYNQNLARELNRVAEIGLQLNIRCSAEAIWGVRLKNGSHQLVVQVNIEHNQLIVDRNGNQAVFETKAIAADAEGMFALTNFDSQLVVSWNGTLVCHGECDLFQNCENSTAISIGGLAGEVELSRFKLFRDVYYFSGKQYVDKKRRSWKLGEEEYFVLGDNVPISVDSRNFGPVRLDEIVGTLQPGETGEGDSRGRDGHYPLE